MNSPSRTTSVFAYVVASLAIFGGCRPGNQFVPPPPPTVTVAHPIEKSFADTIEFIGVAQPTKTVDIRARVSGYLEKILFEDGAEVEVGQDLFEIDPKPYQSVLDAAKAALQRAVASLALAQSQYRRMEPLITNSVITQEELDVQAAQVETSKADVAAAEAAVRQAELNLGYTKITAPISGRVGRHMVDVGNLVREEQTLLANIQTLDPIYSIFDVSENELLKFMAMLRKKELPDPEKEPPVLHLALANEDGFPHEGKLDFRDLTINPTTGTAMRRAIFPNPGRQIIPGMDVRIQADIGEPKPRILVEERAIGSDQRGDYVLVVNDKHIVEYRPVKLSSRFGNFRVVDDGVKADEWIVVNGMQRARPGSEVKPEPVGEAKEEGQSTETETPEASSDAKMPETTPATRSDGQAAQKLQPASAEQKSEPAESKK